MAFPVITMAGDFEAGNVTNHDFTYPSGIEEDDLIIVVISVNASGGTLSYPTGFVELDNVSASSSVRVACAYKWADGTETGVDQIDGTIATESSSVCARITGADPLINPQISAAVTTLAGQSLDPPNLAASPAELKDYLWLALIGTDQFEAVTGPSNMTGVNLRVRDDANGATVMMDSHSLNALSFNPNTFNWGTSEAAYCWTLCVHPTPPEPTSTPASIMSGNIAMSGNMGWIR
jgi:hypothetical protein